MHLKPPEISVLNETSMAAAHHFFKSGAAPAPNFDLDQTSRPPVTIVTGVYAARMTPTGRGLACRVALWFTGS